MKKLALMMPLALMSLACASRGYLDSDVVEPENLGTASASNVNVMGEMMTGGTLTYEGKGTVSEVAQGYVKAMRKAGWEARTADGDGQSAMQCTMVKDSRKVDFSVTAGAEGKVKMVIQVGPAK